MPKLEIAAGESLHYEYETPGAAGTTFVFVNALTGSTGTWQHPEIGPGPPRRRCSTLPARSGAEGRVQRQFADRLKFIVYSDMGKSPKTKYATVLRGSARSRLYNVKGWPLPLL